MTTPDTTPRHEARALTSQERADLERRALAAWFKDPDSTQHKPAAPVQARCASKAKTDKETGDTHPLHFVVIHAGADILAVYRVRPVKDYFMLRRLARWPRDLVRLKAQ